MKFLDHLEPIKNSLSGDEGEDKHLTIWLMNDRTAEHTQYRISMRMLKKVAICVALVVLVVPGVFFGSGIMCSGLGGPGDPGGTAVAVMPAIPVTCAPSAARSQAGDEDVPLISSASGSLLKNLKTSAPAEGPSNEELAQLTHKLNALEARANKSYRRTRQTLAAIDNELDRWFPQGGAGDGDDFAEPEGGDSDTVPPVPTFGHNQLAQLENVRNRLGRLDGQLQGYERSLDELTNAWGDRNVVFATFPTFWPVSTGRISSPFGMRIHPILGEFKMHTGVDISGPKGTPIYAASAGVVTFSDRRGGYGNAVIIDHGYGITTLYGHCDQLLVGAGERVEKGAKIAEMGSTGRSTGPHLHFEIRIKDIPIDPMNYLIAFTSTP